MKGTVRVKTVTENACKASLEGGLTSSKDILRRGGAKVRRGRGGEEGTDEKEEDLCQAPLAHLPQGLTQDNFRRAWVVNATQL